MTMDEHIDCDRQLNEAEDRIKELEADICPSWMGKEKGCNEAQDVVGLEERIKKLEAHLMNINTCVAIIANDEIVRTSKELPKILANLEKYVEDALEGK